MSTSVGVRGSYCSGRAAGLFRGYLFIAGAALCWAVSASLGRAAFTGRLFGEALQPIEPLILAQSRSTISLLVLAPVLLWCRGTAVLRISWRDLWLGVAIGVLGVAGSNYCYYFAIQRTNVATAIVLQYTSPILVLLYMVIRGLQRPTARRVGAVVLAMAGAGLAIGIVGSGRVRLDSIGVAAALAAAVAFAWYNIAGGHLVARRDCWSVLLWALFGATIFWQFVNPPWKVMAAHYSEAQWLFLGVFAIGSVLVPFSLYFAGLELLDPTRAIIGSCLEPVFSIVIAAAALGETMGPLQVMGMLMVLGAILLAQVPEGTESMAAEAAAESAD